MLNVPVLVGSIVAILALALGARLLGLGGGTIDADEAMAEAEAQVPGFHARAALELGGGWAVEGVDGRRVRLRAHGARWVAE